MSILEKREEGLQADGAEERTETAGGLPGKAPGEGAPGEEAPVEGAPGEVAPVEVAPEEEEARLLREENERLRREIERVKELSIKERLYDHVHVSVRTLDIFIGVMIALGVFVVILGMINR